MRRPTPCAMTRVCAWGGMACLALTPLLSQAQAPGLRDPTVPPLEAGLGAAAPGEQTKTLKPGSLAIIVRDGQPYVVIGTRLYATGQQLGQAHIERISETEVWLREGGVVRKISQFSGIERRAVAPVVALPDCAAGVVAEPSQKSPPASPCNGAKPRGTFP